MSTDSVQPPRVYQMIADEIEGAVLSGELKPGDRLPSERDLVERYGVSRPTVREALRVLESNYLVKSRLGDRRGPIVLPLTSHSLQKALRRLTSVNEVGLGPLLQFRMIIDSAAASLAAALRTDEDLIEMERANARMRVSVDLGYEEFTRADYDFHKVIANASRNPLLGLSGEAVRSSVVALMQQRIIDAGDSRAQMQSSIRHHDEVLEAVRTRNGRQASWLTRDGLYWYYFDYVSPEDRPGLRALADEVRETPSQTGNNHER